MLNWFIYSWTCLFLPTKGPGRYVVLYRMSEYSDFILVNNRNTLEPSFSEVTWYRKTLVSDWTSCTVFVLVRISHMQKCTFFEFDEKKFSVLKYRKSYQVIYGSTHFEIHVAYVIGNKHIFETELKRCCNKLRQFVFAKIYTDFPSL